MSKDELKTMMLGEYCPMTEVQNLEQEFWNLTIKGSEVEAYTTWLTKLTTPRGEQQTEIRGDPSQQGREKWSEEYDDSNWNPRKLTRTFFINNLYSTTYFNFNIERSRKDPKIGKH